MLLTNINFEGKVSGKVLGEFYSDVEKYFETAEFVLLCMKFFEDQPFIAEMRSICWNVAVDIRKAILRKKEEGYKFENEISTRRSVTEASKATVRYIGGYSVADVRKRYVKRKERLRYSKQNVEEYKEMIKCSRLIESLTEDEQLVKETTKYPESLQEIDRRQYVNRGLTNIGDKLFIFFLKLSENAIMFLNSNALNQKGGDLFNFVLEEVMKASGLNLEFKTIARNTYLQRENEHIEDEVVDKVYKDIVRKVLMVTFGEFRRDLLDFFLVEKKMAHRKQIQISGKANQKVQVKKNVNDNNGSVDSDLENEPPKEKGKRKRPLRKGKKVNEDESEVKTKVNRKRSCTPKCNASHETSESDDSPKYKRKRKSVLDETTESADDNGNKKDKARGGALILDSPQPETSQNNYSLVEKKLIDVEMCLEFSSNEVDTDEDDEICMKCLTKDKDSQWINCDSCSKWIHRSCAGLKHHMKWKKANRKGVPFYCYSCE